MDTLKTVRESISMSTSMCNAIQSKDYGALKKCIADTTDIWKQNWESRVPTRLPYYYSSDNPKHSEMTPIQCAAFNDDCLALHLLAYGGGDIIDPQGARNETPLHFAASSGAMSAAILLLSYNASPSCPCPTDGWTPLHACALSGQWQMMNLLIESGANPCMISWRCFPFDKPSDHDYGCTAFDVVMMTKISNSVITSPVMGFKYVPEMHVVDAEPVPVESEVIEQARVTCMLQRYLHVNSTSCKCFGCQLAAFVNTQYKLSKSVFKVVIDAFKRSITYDSFLSKDKYKPMMINYSNDGSCINVRDELCIQIVSDLHLEHWQRQLMIENESPALEHEDFDKIIIPCAPILALLGDIDTDQVCCRHMSSSWPG